MLAESNQSDVAAVVRRTAWAIRCLDRKQPPALQNTWTGQPELDLIRIQNSTPQATRQSNHARREQTERLLHSSRA
jgi:hypothetical protein